MGDRYFQVCVKTSIDGDQVEVILNGVTIAGGAGIPLPPRAGAIRVEGTLMPGVNKLTVRALNVGSVMPNTAIVQIDKNDVLQGEPRRFLGSPSSGFDVDYYFGFPQIGVSQGNHPQSAQHIQEAWAGLPSEFRPSTIEIATARLLTIDRPGIGLRRSQSIPSSMASCPEYHINPNNGKLQIDQRDEYPPAMFRENKGNAHLKCINGWDNGGSGKSFDLQISNYRVKPTSSPVALARDNVVEFVITP